jgi:hypothetical protein
LYRGVAPERLDVEHAQPELLGHRFLDQRDAFVRQLEVRSRATPAANRKDRVGAEQ